MIELSDDGAGIDRERVRAVAMAKGLVGPDAVLSDADVDNLIFAPGFSTASAVSSVSGRGVGLDAVKKSLQSIGGRVSIASRPNAGSTFTISLPLTLAVLDGMVLSAAGRTLVVPVNAIVETRKPKEWRVHAMGSSARVVALQDALVPLVDVALRLGFRTHPADLSTGVVVAIESDTGARCALLVDSIVDLRQIVVKSLEANCGRIPDIAAATILGDGQVALILDVDALTAPSVRRAIPCPKVA